jgi:UDP-N-acetylmuramyl tripeptide synthase
MTTMTTAQLAEMLRQMREANVSPEIIEAAIKALMDNGVVFVDY